MNESEASHSAFIVSAGCHINDVMNGANLLDNSSMVSAGCHINDVMNVCN